MSANPKVNNIITSNYFYTHKKSNYTAKYDSLYIPIYNRPSKTLITMVVMYPSPFEPGLLLEIRGALVAIQSTEVTLRFEVITAIIKLCLFKSGN